MDKLIEIVKIFAIAQLILITLLIIGFFLTRIYFFYKERRAIKIRLKIHQIWKNAFDKKNLLTMSELALIKKNAFETLIYLSELENKYNKEPHYFSLINQLSIEIFKPLSRRLASSRNWLKRYTAALGYSFGFENVDEANLINLVKDKSLLVALNASTTLIKHPAPKTINAIIDVFAQGRRLKQAVCSELLISTPTDISPIVLERLEHESDIYTRIFCYRILCKLPSQATICAKAKEDIFSQSIDLKIATLHYIDHTQDDSKGDYIFSLTQDSHWEVRAATAKLLSNHKSGKSLHVLTTMLNDSQWWVCMNAAHSIGNHGEAGMAILSGQTPDANNFSFEIAQNLIKQLERQTPNSFN